MDTIQIESSLTVADRIKNIDPIRAIMFCDMNKRTVLGEYAFVKYVYKPLGLEDDYPLTLEHLPSCHDALKTLTLCYVRGLIFKSHFVKAMTLLAEKKHEELHSTYLCSNPKMLIVPNKYRNKKLVATLKAGLLKRSTNYYTVGIHRKILNLDFSDSVNYEIPSIDDLQYDQSTLKFVHDLAAKTKRNTLLPYFPAIIEFIRDLDVKNRLVVNHSFCQYLLGILLNRIRYTNIKILVSVPKSLSELRINSVARTKLCFGLNNKNKRLYNKTTCICVCVYCYSVVNIAFRSKNEPKKRATPEDLDRGDVIADRKDVVDADENSDEASNNFIGKKRKRNRSGDEEKANVKRNIVKTKIYTDNINPASIVYCREKHREVKTIRLRDYTSTGKFIDRQVIWGINKTTAYWIQLSDDFSTINISHHKKNVFTSVCSLNTNITFDKNDTCREILLNKGYSTEEEEKLFNAKACDLCYIKHRNL